MFTLDTPYGTTEYDTVADILDALDSLTPGEPVHVEAPAGRYTGVDTIPYDGESADVAAALADRYWKEG
jgi:hypothetical protein